MLRILLVSVNWLLFAIGAHATSFVSQPFTDTLSRAEIIVRGRIGSSHADWGPRKRIFTYTELSVIEILKGSDVLRDSVTDGVITVREFGGQKDGVGLSVPGSAHFQKGEEVVLLLKPQDEVDRSFPIRGLMMGKLNLKKNASGQWVLSGPALVGEKHEGGSHSDHTDRSQNETSSEWSLERLRQHLRTSGESNLSEPRGKHSLVDENTQENVPSASPLHSSDVETSASQGESGPAGSHAVEAHQSRWSRARIGLYGGLLGLMGLFLVLYLIKLKK